MRWLHLSVVGAFSALSVFSCGGGDDGGGSGGAGGGGTNACVPTAAECYVSGPTGPGAECLAKHDNTGSDVWQGRITQITVKSPQKLAEKFVQEQIVDNGIFLNQADCRENGEGTFTWLFEFNKTTGKLKTGGGLPISDPKAGGCWLNMTSTPLPIAPIEVDVTVDPDGLGFSATGIDVFVPIFATPTDTTNPIILPLHGVELSGKWNDDSHNCIGKHNGAELDPILDCFPDTPNGQRLWTGGAVLKGHITIDEADQVFVEDLGSTLCVFLAGVANWKGTASDCKTSDKWKAGERPPGDWCAATNSPADATCQDAWRLEADFGAAGFKINGDCP